MILSILICTLEERKERFEELRKHLYNSYVGSDVELLYLSDNREITTGAKRNDLLKDAKGEYCVFIDDDDWVPDYYIWELMKATRSGADCFAINGTMTTNGANERKWFIALGNPYIADWSTGEEIYLRPPNHICCMKTAIAREIGFKDITIGEDYDFCMRLQQSGLLKTQHVIEKPMYHYQYNDRK